VVGLRARCSSHPAITMALDQERYVVSAGAFWKAKRNSKRPTILFHGTGIDDKDDAVVWFSQTQPSSGSWIEIEIVETDSGDWPRRTPRRKVDWRAIFRRKQARDRRTLEALSMRIQRLGPQPVSAREWDRSLRPPSCGFLLTLDDQALGRIGVGNPGSMHVDVFLKRSAKGVSIRLQADGSETLGSDARRWRHWSWVERPLRIGQRLRIDVVEPTDLDLGDVRRVVSFVPRGESEIRSAIKGLRAAIRSNLYSKQARQMITLNRNRPEPRHYPREPIRER